MKSRTICLAIAYLLTGSEIAADTNIQATWEDPSKYSTVAQAGGGFSFKYGGETVGPAFSDDWRPSVVADTQPRFAELKLTHGSGLQVTRKTRTLEGFDAVEYKLAFRNESREVLPPISEVNAIDISFSSSNTDEVCVISSGGGLTDFYLPPRAFAIRRNCFSPTIPHTGVLGLTTEGGRSSNKDLPFFFIQNETRQEGIFVAFGWSGQWQAVAAQNYPPGLLTLKGKIPGLEIALEPGEEVEGPTILVGLYKGSLADGSNRLRRLIRDKYTPTLAGARVSPMAVFDHFWNVGVDFDEILLKKQADGAAAIGQEYFILDAGWYAGTGRGYDFNSGLGNWNEVDKRKLPNGLGPVADYIRSKGLKFGLWFEPERVARGTQLAREHPDWILWKNGEEQTSSDLWIWRDLAPEYFKDTYGLLDYGHPEVQLWVRSLLDRYISDYDVKLLKYDLNLDPLPYWRANDRPNRRGMTQLRHIQGLYAIIDWLRERHPDVVFEGCASGGRRIDLETVRRFHTFSISDHNVDPAIMRFHLFGINHFLPGNYHKLEYTLPTPDLKDFQPHDLQFQSLFGGAAGSGGRVDLWSDDMKRKAQFHVRIWKELRNYLMEDYYPLSNQPADVKTWSGWQFHDPNYQSGFVQTFRTKTPEDTHRFFVHGLDESASYLFTDAYARRSFEMTGLIAMTEGIEVTQEPMSSKVFMYRKVSRMPAQSISK